ncbi:MAG: phage holin family protein [Pelagibaca sp.]
MTQPNPGPGDLPGLIGSIVAEARALLRTELQLARRELADSASRAGSGLMLFGLAALVAFVGLSALAVAAVLGAAAFGVAYHWAAVIVAGVFLAIALTLALMGKSRLSATSLAPKRAINQVKSDLDTIKEAARA